MRNTPAYFALAKTAPERNALGVGNLGRRAHLNLGHNYRLRPSCKTTALRERRNAVKRTSRDRPGRNARDL